jgi:large subunit ribosomal protein L25
MENRIAVHKRNVTGKHVKKMRLEGFLPAVIYGPGIKEPTPIQMDLRDASKILRGISPSTIVTLDLDGEEIETLVRDAQFQILRGGLVHVDFLALVTGELVRTDVNVELFGEAPAVKEHFALITSGLDSLEVEALPKDLPELIRVDISSLLEVGDSITVQDLVLPEGVTMLEDPETMIAVASAPSAEEDLDAEEELEGDLEFEDGAAEPEIIEKGKADEDGEG